MSDRLRDLARWIEARPWNRPGPIKLLSSARCGSTGSSNTRSEARGVSRPTSGYLSGLTALVEAGVQLVIVGVGGINFYAREPAQAFATLDLDALLEPTIANLKGALRALFCARLTSSRRAVSHSWIGATKLLFTASWNSAPR